jgi:hypothetical protein
MWFAAGLLTGGLSVVTLVLLSENQRQDEIQQLLDEAYMKGRERGQQEGRNQL